MSSIGERLRQERLRRGLELDQIAERTRISSRFLEAIEAEELDKLPGGFFTRSFVRQYAQLLDLDDGELEAELEKLTEDAEPALAPAPPLSQQFDLAPISPSRKTGRLDPRRALASLAGFVVVILVCSGFYALWQRPWRESPPEGSVAPVNAPAPAAPPAQTLPAEPVPPAGQPSPPAAVPDTPTNPPAPAAAPILVEIRATEEVWIRVSSDGKYLYSGTLKAGQTRTFEGQNAMSLLTGNAGGLEIGFNGKALGPIGPKGQIRTLELTPQGYQIVERKPAPPPDML